MRVTARTWDTIQIPETLRNFLAQKRKPTLRKVRLYAVATCRRFWDQLPTPECRELVRAVENYVEGEVSWADVMAAKHELRLATEVRVDEWQRTPPGRRLLELCGAVGSTADNRLWYVLAVYTWSICSTIAPYFWNHVDAAQCDLIREVFVHPFRKVKLNKKWLTGTVVSLAQQMYDSRDFSAMPILADALQDAGCDSADILTHCRGPGPHVRGCWVVDLVLGRE